MSVSAFLGVKKAEPPEGFIPHIKYFKDISKDKLLLGIGAYRSNDGKPFVFPVVRKTEYILANDENLTKEYAIPEEDNAFKRLAVECILGANSSVIKEKRFYIAPWVAGAGSLRIGAEFLTKILRKKIYYCSKPCWESYKLIFKNAGFEEGREYRYWSNTSKDLDFNGLLEDLNNAPQDAVVILQVCGHNPTGVDPTEEQWRQLAEVVKKKKLFPFLDMAFQGLVSGDLDKDAFAVRLFADLGIEFFCAYSFSKSMGLYNERVGVLLVVVSDANILLPKPYFSPLELNVAWRMRFLCIRPPVHGMRVASYILEHEDFKNEWKNTILEIVIRIKEMRKQLKENLEKLDTPGDWRHITRQVGTFCYLGINEKQVDYLAEKYHIHIPRKGYFAVAALNQSNIEYVSKALHETIVNCI